MEQKSNAKSRPHSNTNFQKRKNKRFFPKNHAGNSEPDASSSAYVSEGPASMNAQIYSFLNQVLLNPEIRGSVISTVLQDLGPCLVREFGYCTPYIFGSMANGLSLCGSDMDIYLHIADYQNSVPSPNFKQELVAVVERCAGALRYDRRFHRIVAISQARVPIVKFVHKYTNMSGDISFKNPLGLHNTRLLSYYLSLHPRFFEVMVIIKFWAKQHSICTFEYISSYGWTILLISYLQTLRQPDGTRLLPSVHDMQKDIPAAPGSSVTGWRVDFHPYINRVFLPDDPKFSHLGLLEGFFTYYSNFSFEDNIVCPFLGQPIPWSGLASSDANTFPSEFQWYQRHMRRFFIDKVERRPLVSIQDPFQHDFLLGGSCSEKKFEKVMAYLTVAAELCRIEQQLQDPNKSTLLKDLFTYAVESSVGKFEFTLKSPPGLQRNDFVDLAVHTLEDIFRDIMKFEISSQSNASLSSGEMSSKVSKTGEAQNVHQCDDGEKFEKTYNCAASQPVWNFRKKLRKNVKLSIPETVFDFERKLSDEIVSHKFPVENVEFSCTVSVPKKNLSMSISFEERCREKSNNVSSMIFQFLKSNIPSWLNSFIPGKCASSAALPVDEQTESCHSVEEIPTAGDAKEDKELVILEPDPEGAQGRVTLDPDPEGAQERVTLEPDPEGAQERVTLEPDPEGAQERVTLEPDPEGDQECVILEPDAS